MDYVVGVLVMAAVIAAGVMLSKRGAAKRLNDAWEGTVTKRWIATYSDDDGDTTKTPTIKVHLSTGKSKQLSVSAATYNTLKEGDHVKKEAGQKDPTKA